MSWGLRAIYFVAGDLQLLFFRNLILLFPRAVPTSAFRSKNKFGVDWSKRPHTPRLNAWYFSSAVGHEVGIVSHLLFEELIGKSFEPGFVFYEVRSHLPVPNYLSMVVIEGQLEHLVKLGEQLFCLFLTCHSHKHFDLKLVRELFNI